MPNLTLQICQNQRWEDALTLEFPSPELGPGGPIKASYHTAYAAASLNRETDASLPCSLTFPPSLFDVQTRNSWFNWVDDIRPAGASERYWVNTLGLGHLRESQRAFSLLQQGTIAPIGNLRIKEALPQRLTVSELRVMRFATAQVVERDGDFLAYAQAMGAAAGGATGAGGDAPKFLLRVSPQDEVWIDTYQDDFNQSDAHYLVKFPRNKRTADDCDILRAEFHYYHELQYLGINTINTDGMRLIEGERYPSLWLPRFDREIFPQGQTQVYGVESIYAIAEKPPASALNHFDVIRQIVDKLGVYPHFDRGGFIREWVRRDFLNVVFGNTDNHGRNHAFLKTPTALALSPIYDFAPMKVDSEGVMRSITWGSPFEEGANFNWRQICAVVAEKHSADTDELRLFGDLQQLAAKLAGLRARLDNRGVPKRILDYPSLHFATLEQKLKQWGLV